MLHCTTLALILSVSACGRTTAPRDPGPPTAAHEPAPAAVPPLEIDIATVAPAPKKFKPQSRAYVRWENEDDRPRVRRLTAEELEQKTRPTTDDAAATPAVEAIRAAR